MIVADETPIAKSCKPARITVTDKLAECDRDPLVAIIGIVYVPVGVDPATDTTSWAAAVPANGTGIGLALKLRLNPLTVVVVRVTGEENVPEACNVSVEVVCEP
jgi:hypothetical protein